MTERIRRRARWPAPVLMGLAVGMAASAFWLQTRGPDPELHRAARAGREKAAQILTGLARGREARATAAARIPQLLAGLDSGYDPATFQDALETEAWWAPVRADWALSALVVGRQPFAVVRAKGAGAVDPGLVSSAPVVGRARESRQASGVLAAGGELYLVSAALVAGAGRAAPESAPVVLVAERLDERILNQLAAASGGAVGISDGRTLLFTAGADDGRPRLAPLVGQEAAGTQVLPEGWLGAPLALEVGGPWVWTIFRTPTTLLPVLRAGLWGLSGALALVAALLLLLAGRSGGQPRSTGRQDEITHLDHGDRPASGGGPAVGPSGARSARPASGRSHTAPGPGPALATALAPPTAITMGRYSLLEQIGEGGMAEIHMAAIFGPEGFKRHFVVKRLHPNLARRKDVVSQFIDEARLQARLSHPNIVPVFDFGRAGDEYYLALEYIHGRDLDKIVQKHMLMFQRGLPLSVTAYVMHEVLDALNYAHAKTDEHGRPLEIVHRDVSPANVLVSYRGDVKLSDFGIVKADQRVSRTEVGLVKGNVSYMSPEQARGEDVDLRSDIFSAAVVIFHCLTGQALYRGETTLNQLVRAAVGPATSQFDQIESLPREIAPILARALVLDPARRYQSAADFARDLAPLVGRGRVELAALLADLFPAELRKDIA